MKENRVTFQIEKIYKDESKQGNCDRVINVPVFACSKIKQPKQTQCSVMSTNLIFLLNWKRGWHVWKFDMITNFLFYYYSSFEILM